MRNADIIIAGGGLAGSLAGSVLGRAGFKVVLIDPHPTYPEDFRCEKLDGRQIRVLQKTGLATPLMRSMSAHRCGAAVQRPHSALVRHPRHGRRKDRYLLRRQY
jgi:2-polyprenyl-6-methoxyphenol hydroxylase-like FAD-dependent oxidoreductase